MLKCRLYFDPQYGILVQHCTIGKLFTKQILESFEEKDHEKKINEFYGSEPVSSSSLVDSQREEELD